MVEPYPRLIIYFICAARAEPYELWQGSGMELVMILKSPSRSEYLQSIS